MDSLAQTADGKVVATEYLKQWSMGSNVRRALQPKPAFAGPAERNYNLKNKRLRKFLQYEQQIKYAQTEAERVKQEETVKQNTAIGEANKTVVTIEKQAQQEYEVALTQARQKLAVAKLRLEAARQQAEATVARGQAEAAILLLQKQAEAAPLRQQIAAFGGGDAYARYLFYQRIAPSIKSILSNIEGPFADLFKQLKVSPPKTHAELLDVCKRVAAAGKIPVAIAPSDTTAVRLVNHLVKTEEGFDFQAELERLILLAERRQFGPSTQAIIDEALSRDIPGCV